jgi:ABC-type phosphate/phosphonate transport system substrate-binding protein
MIANARMYAVTKPVEQAWQTLLCRLAQCAEVAWDYVEHAPPAPISALWSRPDCGCVFMCGFPYVTSAARPSLLAAPVPSLPRYGGRPVYFTEFLVRASTNVQSLAHTFGGRLACMLPESNSGHNAPRHYLLQHAAPGTRALYRPTESPTPTPYEVIDAVISGRADVGVVDSYLLDLMRLHAPERLVPLKSVAVTPASPIPPLVASPGIDGHTVARVRAALLELHRDADAAYQMTGLGLLRFAAVEASDYGVLAAWADRANAAGFELTGTANADPRPFS